MAVKLLTRKRNPYTDCRYEEYICDTDADFADLPPSCTGSKAISLWSKKERVVNTKGRWVPYGECAINAPILDLVKEEGEGGVPEFGTAWKFKDVITPDEIKAVASHYTPNEMGIYSIRWEDGLGLQITILDLDVIVPQQAPPDFVIEGKMGTFYQVTYNPWTTLSSDIWFYTERSELTDYGAEIYSLMMTGGELPVPPQGWVQGPDSTDVVEIAPTIPSVTENFGINAEYVAPLFEVAGGIKTMLSVTDTNDEGIVASYEVYADDALVDTVPKAETIDATALGVTAGASVTVKAKSIIDTTSEASNAVIFE